VSALLPFIVIGVTAGSVYGLTGTGLVLTYKTSGIFNFAQGSVAALAVFVFYWLHVEHGMAWPLAAILVVFGLGTVTGIALERLANLLAFVSDTLKIASSIGIVLLVLGIGQVWYPTAPIVPAYLPINTIRILGVNVGYNEIIIFVVALVATFALHYFLRLSRLGMAMRAVVDDPDLLAMTKEPTRVRRGAWIIGSVFASLSGVLLAPNLSINAIVLTLLVVQAFGAAAIGYFSSLPLTYLGGLFIGIAGAVSTKYVGQVPWLGGLPPSLPFIILFVALIVTPRSKLAKRQFIASKALPEVWHAPTRVRLLCGGLFLVLLCFVPSFAGTNLSIYSTGLVDVILFLSLGLLIRQAGQVSLCQYAFAAVGAAAVAHFTNGFGIPWFFAVLLAGLVAIPVGAIIAIPAIRLTGVFLALATLGFGVLMENLFYTQGWMFGPNTNGIPAARPSFGSLGTDTGFYYVILAFVVFAVALIMFIREGRLGRILKAMSDSPLALETHGATVNVARVLVFSISSFMAAIAGALTASLSHFSAGSEFSSFGSLELVALVVIITVGDPWYAILAGFSLEVLPAYINLGNITVYLAMLFGVSATIMPAIITRAKNLGAPQPVRNLALRIDAMLGGKSGRMALATAGAVASGAVSFPSLVSGPTLGNASPAGSSTSAHKPAMTSLGRPVNGPDPAAVGSGGEGALLGSEAEINRSPTIQREGLEIKNLAVHYGGSVAVTNFHLRAPLGQITGLIGPNGAGKTTVFNACGGLLRPTIGQIFVHGVDVSKEGPARRARRGLGRTFQRVELFSSLSVGANVAIGREATLAGGNPLNQLTGLPGDRAVVRAAVEQAADLTGIESFLEKPVTDISSGQRRLVELARVLAGPFDMILLDEPSSGLDQAETEEFGRILRQVVAQRGVGILIVEHDMSLVRQICDRVCVLDFGQQIFEGTVSEMLASSVVKAAYLGGGDELAPIEASIAGEASKPS